MRRVRLVSACTLLTILSTIAPAAAQGPSPGIAIPVVSTDSEAAFNGVFTLRRFVPVDNGVAAVGILTGVATPTGGAPTSIYRTIVVPVAVNNPTSTAVEPSAVGAAACGILHLDLGPLFLDLLGLQIDLSEVILDITAQSGPGNLLGNLLCAVTGLLDSPGGLARLLNQILGILG
jgi:hypothetical protein